MVAKLRVLAALCALVAAVIVVWQTNPAGPLQVRRVRHPDDQRHHQHQVAGHRHNRPGSVQPVPRHPARRGRSRLGLAFTPPTPEEGLRCKYDAGNYQMTVEAFVWRTYEEALPADAVELDIDGHRAAQYWIMKPTDWNNRWWITCAIGVRHQLRPDPADDLLLADLLRPRPRLHADQPAARARAGAALQVPGRPLASDLVHRASSVRASRWSPHRPTGSARRPAAAPETSSSPAARPSRREPRWDR